jgi:Uma2 family endonuclease
VSHMSRSASVVLPGGLEPAWDIARLFPPQGGWSEEEYLALPGNPLAEFDHGRIEVLDMPTETHQLLVGYLYRALLEFVSASGLGTVLFAPFPIKLWEGKIREPDICFMRHDHAGRRDNKFWQGADLVMEVMSPDDRKRDSEIKRREYAMAGIPEYWLIDPTNQTVTIFVLAADADRYAVRGVYESGQAASECVRGFVIDVQVLFAKAGQGG